MNTKKLRQWSYALAIAMVFMFYLGGRDYFNHVSCSSLQDLGGRLYIH